MAPRDCLHPPASIQLLFIGFFAGGALVKIAATDKDLHCDSVTHDSDCKPSQRTNPSKISITIRDLHAGACLHRWHSTDGQMRLGTMIISKDEVVPKVFEDLVRTT